MKRKIIASLLGIAGSMALVAASHGQGSVNFANYTSDVNAPVTFGQTQSGNGVTGVSGGFVGSEFTAALMYSLDGGANYTLLTTAASGNAGYPTAFLGTDNGAPGTGAGYFIASPATVTIPGYSSGPVSFIVQAYHGANYAAADWKGQSAVFTLPSLATGLSTPGNLVGMQGFVVTVPEPSVFALAGLGAAGLMAFRRKKA